MRQPTTAFPLLFAAAVACLIAATCLRAQSVRWDPPSGQLGYNQVSELSLVFSDCEPAGTPQLPAIDGLQVGRPSPRSETKPAVRRGRAGGPC